MNIVVGGSYHSPNWEEVKKTMEQLENAGHTIIAPGIEWEPISDSAKIARPKSELTRINPDEEFIRFEGEKDISIKLLQSKFYEKILKYADVFVVVDKEGYMGQTVTMEALCATLVNLLKNRNLPIYFTEKPTIFTIFDEKGTLVLNDSMKQLSQFVASLKTLQGVKFLGPDETRIELEKIGVHKPQEEYDLLYPYHYELYKYMVTHPDIYHFGLGNLLELGKANATPGRVITGNDGDER